MAHDNTITLFDLQLATGATISPLSGRRSTRSSYKGFDIEIVPGGFTGIRERTGGFHDRVPVIVDRRPLDEGELGDRRIPRRRVSRAAAAVLRATA